MSTLTQFLGGRPRRQFVTLTASNSAYPIPEFARGGRGLVYVTGVGGGGSGRISVTSGQRGVGGDAGAIAFNHPILIPTGVTTLNAQIGAGGAAVTGAAATNGNNGGDTSLTIGSIVLTLGGGRGGQSLPTGITATTGIPRLGPADASLDRSQGRVSQLISAGGINSLQGLAVTGSLGAGTIGADGATAPFGAGAHSPFGAGGAGLTVGPSANTNGANADGFGAGGAGALWISGGNVSSGAGSPGILILEFVEGL